jgi:hypothetical protein
MAQSDKSQGRRPWLAPAWAWLGVVLWLLGPGCLNPWPDDYPSNESDSNTNFVDPPASVPSGDGDCGRNPLLADCEVPTMNPVDPADSTPDDSGDPDELGGGRDAGRDAGRGDAGAPDAGVTANK